MSFRYGMDVIVYFNGSVKSIGHVPAIPQADAVMYGRSYMDESA